MLEAKKMTTLIGSCACDVMYRRLHKFRRVKRALCWISDRRRNGGHRRSPDKYDGLNTIRKTSVSTQETQKRERKGLPNMHEGLRSKVNLGSCTKSDIHTFAPFQYKRRVAVYTVLSLLRRLSRMGDWRSVSPRYVIGLHDKCR